ncbi:hypothetical protein [Hymenobacter arizonensis]|uniref:Outer membrane protein beta-barrel domain-containing protein n=1 Tax=Hymenobacter arizonensis TaxID=1227077 RepID=A0A1I6AIW6_HYMAR|nr:hypothetical protein [Hymenobacter arizonensis]SFQ68612.1 hypothetical protein SAMN04515668_3731 [Hymenobacter arizonensis]
MRRFFSVCGGLLGSVLLAPPPGAAAQTAAPADTLPARRWHAPHHLVGQFAGGQGLITAGVGYRLNRNRLDLDLLAGYVPRRYSITPMGIFTAKATFMPWTVPLGPRGWAVRPLALGGYLSYTASKGLNATQDGKYPSGYYWWSAHGRVGGFLGGRIAYPLPAKRPGAAPRLVSLYYELGTNDLYLASWWGNPRGLSPLDVATLGVGLKLDL